MRGRRVEGGGTEEGAAVVGMLARELWGLGALRRGVGYGGSGESGYGVSGLWRGDAEGVMGVGMWGGVL